MSKNVQFPSQKKALSSNIENSIFSTIKLRSTLVDDKYAGIKKAFSHRIYFIKLFAFS